MAILTIVKGRWRSVSGRKFSSIRKCCVVCVCMCMYVCVCVCVCVFFYAKDLHLKCQPREVWIFRGKKQRVKKKGKVSKTGAVVMPRSGPSRAFLK